MTDLASSHGSRAHRRVPVLVLVLLGLSTLAGAQVPSDPGAMALPLITDQDAVWTMPVERRTLEHRCRFEGRIHFVDNAWNNLWMEGPGGARYIQLSGADLPVRSGQRVLIEGTYIPARGLDADTLTVTVLEENTAVEPLDTAGRIGDIRTFDRHVVTTEAYVDDQQLIDAEHLRLYLIIDDRPVIGWVRPDDASAVPDYRRAFVRIQAVYSGRMDPTGTESTIELWVPRQADVEVVQSIQRAPLFDLPVTAIQRISEVERGTSARIQGRLQRRDPGRSVVIRDDTGEIEVRSLQRERLPQGAEVEAVGRLVVDGARWVLESGLFRRTATESRVGAAPEAAMSDDVLRRVEHIRQLTREQAAAGRAVEISGIVVWSMPGVDFFFINDLSGGVRVHRAGGMAEPPLQKAVRVVGRTRAGPVSAEVEASDVHDIGSMAHPKPVAITVDQARNGTEDGQWVSIRGFLRRVDSEGDWRWIHVTSPDGEFVGHLQSPVTFVATPGSLIRIQGVCDSVADASGRITGTVLRVPFLHDITIEEDAPADLFDLPLQPASGLRAFAALNDMAHARVSGTVLHQELESLVIQDGATALRVLTRTSTAVDPGDQVEAVGIVGRAGARVVLREADVRRVAGGREPEPIDITAQAPLEPALDERLVRVRATVADVSTRPGRLSLTLNEGEVFFECVLEHAADDQLDPRIAAGAVVDATGLYRIEFSDAREPRRFLLHLRSADDVRVHTPPRFWTIGRLFAASAVLAGGFLLAGAAAIGLRWRVIQQTEQIRRQLERQAGLEAELERAQRFRALGLFAGGLAHDFNNLLTSIMGNASVALFDKEVAQRAGDCLRDIEDSAGRAHQLTQQLVTFAKGGDPMLEPVDFSGLVQGVARRVLAGSRTRAEVHTPPDLWPVMADRGQLARALENIVIRGRGDPAMRDGLVSIHARNHTVGVDAAASVAPGRYVAVILRGCGAPVPADKLRIFFDPYATTSSDSDRFSMAIVYSIIKRHGGLVTIESSEQDGSVFTVWIPAADALPAPAPVPAAPVRSGNGRPLTGARVLLMDDEESIRRLGERCLRHLGCDVQVAADGGECVRIYQAALQGGRRFDVVILDLTVPGGLGGRETLEALRSIDPTVLAIVSSGYSNDPVMARYREHGFAAVVPKPYALDALTGTLQRVLALAD